MNWFFSALFSHHGFEPETLCLRKIIAVFANVIEVHTKFLFHLATTTCSFFAIRNKCYSMLSMAFESIIVPFMKIQWTGTTETTTKTSPANENSRTNWCEVKLHAKSEMNAHKRERERRYRPNIGREYGSVTGNTGESRATAQTRTANQWMEYNIVWSHMRAHGKYGFEWTLRFDIDYTFARTRREWERAKTDENRCHWSESEAATVRSTRKFSPKIGYVTKTAINLILIFSTFLFTPISEFGADFGPETTHQKQHNESKERKNSWNKET